MFEERPVVICSLPKDVMGSVRCGENVIPETLDTPGTWNACCAPAIPNGRSARNADG